MKSNSVKALIGLFMLFLTGCSSELDFPFSEDGDEITLSFRPKLDTYTSSRSIGDACHIDQLVVAVFENGSEFTRYAYDWDDVADGINVRLIKGHSYQLLFWAQNKDNEAFTINDDATVSVNYSYSGAAKGVNDDFSWMENLDAFYATQVISKTDIVADGPVTLRRAMAQVNLGTDATKPEVGVHRAVISMQGVPTKLSPFAPAESRVSETKDITFTYTDFPDESLSVDGVDYSYVSSCYVLAPATISMTYELYAAESDELILSKEFEITTEPNQRTNILGDIVQDPVTMDVWDGVTLLAPEKEDNAYVIDKAAKLAWLAENGERLESGATFTLACDLDMGNCPLSSVTLPTGATFEGNDCRIVNLNLITGGLFGNPTNFTVSNLNVEISTIASVATHVGTLVNTLTGNGTFTSVNVKGGSVTTTNGAAGGMIGYVKSTKDGTALNVSFYSCTVEDVSLDASAGEGKYIGLLRGYSVGEKVTFDSYCNASVSLDYTSPYKEGNEAEWLQANDYTAYNGWLGDEELRRGNITYGTQRFVPKWDGSTKITPLKDGNYTLIYSAFDLASMQSSSSSSIRFESDVDLAGLKFLPIESVKTLEGNNHTVYNLFVEDAKTPWYGAAFIRLLGGSTVKNITFEGARILGHPNTDMDDHKAYGGVLSGYVTGANTIENVNVKNSYLCAVGKVGGLIGTIQDGSNKTTVTGCNVEGTTVENYKVDVQEEFSAGGGLVTAYFTQNGEVGGLIGFINANCDITNCHVKNGAMNCYGEANQKKSVLIISAIIPGRHVNRFIGDIRTTYAQTVTLTNCSASNVNVKQTQGTKSVNESRLCYKSSNKKVYVDLVGEAYSIYIKVLGKEAGGDKKGTLKIDGTNIPVKTMATSDWPEY